MYQFTIKSCLLILICLLVGVELNAQIFPVPPPASRVASERGYFYWKNPISFGAKIFDIAKGVGVGGSAALIRLGDTNHFDNNDITPLNYKKIVYQVIDNFQHKLIVQTEKDLLLLDFFNRPAGSPYSRVSILPDSLKGIKAAAFLGTATGVIISKNNNVYRTFNGGINWIRTGTMPNAGIKSMVIISVEDIIISTYNGILYRSTNGGQSFQTSANNNEVFSNISFVTDDFAVATSSFRFYKTADRGASWNELLNTPGRSPYFITAASDSIYFLSSDSSIYQTVDAGTSYQRLTPANPYGPLTKFTLGENGSFLGLTFDGRLIQYNNNRWSMLRYNNFQESIENVDRDIDYITQLHQLVGTNFVNTMIPSCVMLNTNNDIIEADYPTRFITSVKLISNEGLDYYLNAANNTLYFLGSASGTNYGWVQKIIVKADKVFLLKGTNNKVYFLPRNNASAPLDSFTVSSPDRIIDIDVFKDSTNNDLYLLGASGKVFIRNINNGTTRFIGSRTSFQAVKFKLSKLLVGTPPYIGVLDNLGRIAIARPTYSYLKDINGSLYVSFRDMAIVGDSLFALNTNNVFYSTYIGDTSRANIWQKDSIDISRTLTQVHIGFYRPTDTAVGQRPGRFRLTPNTITSEKSSIFLSGSGNTLISTNPQALFQALPVKKSIGFHKLSIYPNPVINKQFYLDGGVYSDLTISDLQGRQVAKFSKVEQGSPVVLPETINNGIYLVRSNKNGQLFTGKIIVN